MNILLGGGVLLKEEGDRGGCVCLCVEELNAGGVEGVQPFHTHPHTESRT